MKLNKIFSKKTAKIFRARVREAARSIGRDILEQLTNPRNQSNEELGSIGNRRPRYQDESYLNEDPDYPERRSHEYLETITDTVVQVNDNVLQINEVISSAEFANHNQMKEQSYNLAGQCRRLNEEVKEEVKEEEPAKVLKKMQDLDDSIPKSNTDDILLRG